MSKKTGNNNISIFKDTMQRIENDEKLRKATEKAVSETKIYGEGFYSNKKTNYGKECTIKIEENLTLLSARRLKRKFEKIAVLNYANPIHSVGGVGARGQEEYLCRESNLYSCLLSQTANKYYSYHKKIGNYFSLNGFMASDMIVYSPSVTVFKEDIERNGIIVTEYTDDWFDVDIITCAAPRLVIRSADNKELKELFDIFVSRIKNILEIAIENEIQALVLGAFGCGAYNNPPEIVAGAFENVLNMDRYKTAFREIIFAIKAENRNRSSFEIFKEVF